ncbi:MAG TPA: hypothetical protein VG013_33475 [Gemmataceae bacterium]|jgi:hypothetical protein|nr:hypothetical protein [Gemmataceae bacterium]
MKKWTWIFEMLGPGKTGPAMCIPEHPMGLLSEPPQDSDSRAEPQGREEGRKRGLFFFLPSWLPYGCCLKCFTGVLFFARPGAKHKPWAGSTIRFFAILGADRDSLQGGVGAAQNKKRDVAAEPA